MTDPHGRPPRGALGSAAQVAWHLLTAWPAWWRHVLPALRRGEWVLLDRCHLDLLVDPRRYRYGGPEWLARAALALQPRAAAVLVLDAPEAVVRARKQEVTPEELTRQRAAYRALAARGGAALLDAGAEPAAVAAQARAVLGLDAA